MCIRAFFCTWIFFFTASVVTRITCVSLQLDGISYFLSISGGFWFFPLFFNLHVLSYFWKYPVQSLLYRHWIIVDEFFSRAAFCEYFMGPVPHNNSLREGTVKGKCSAGNTCVFLVLLSLCYETALSGTFWSMPLTNLRLLCTKYFIPLLKVIYLGGSAGRLQYWLLNHHSRNLL